MQLKSVLRPALLIVSLIFAVSLFPQISVVRVGQGFTQGSYQGVYYALPITVIKIHLEIDKVTKIKGPFSEYASEYLGLDEVITRDITTYKLRRANFSTISEPDPGQVYFVAWSDKQSRGEEALLLSLTEAGILIGADLESLQEPFNIGMVTTDHSVDPDSLDRYFSFLASNNFAVRIDTITRKITIDTTTIFQNSYKSKIVQKSDEQKAKEAVEQIENIRANRYNILTGYQEVPYSKEAMKYMIDQLSRMEEEYIDLFRGKIINQRITYTFLYTPVEEDNKGEWMPAFGLSERDGFQELKQANDELFYLRLTSQGISQHIGIKTPGTGQASPGLAIRVPERITLHMKYKGREYEVMNCEIAQFGKLSILPPGTTKMSLYPGTGGVKSVLIPY